MESTVFHKLRSQIFLKKNRFPVWVAPGSPLVLLLTSADPDSTQKQNRSGGEIQIKMHFL